MPTFIGLIAGAVGTRIHAPLVWWRKLPSSLLNILAKFWPWVVIVLVLWFSMSWLLGYTFNQAMLALSGLLFILVDIGLPLLIVFSGIAYDIAHEKEYPLAVLGDLVR